MDKTVVVIIVSLSKWICLFDFVSNSETPEMIIQIIGYQTRLEIGGIRVDIHQNKISIEYLKKIVIS
jgi:hypothetical protein